MTPHERFCNFVGGCWVVATLLKKQTTLHNWWKLVSRYAEDMCSRCSEDLFCQLRWFTFDIAWASMLTKSTMQALFPYVHLSPLGPKTRTFVDFWLGINASAPPFSPALSRSIFPFLFTRTSSTLNFLKHCSLATGWVIGNVTFWRNSGKPRNYGKVGFSLKDMFKKVRCNLATWSACNQRISQNVFIEAAD